MIIVCLTCENDEQADRISDILLNNKLVACAKKLPVKSLFWWEGKIDKSAEVLVMYETVEEKFELIEDKVQHNHSYQTPMLFAIPVTKTTDKVEKWLMEELGR